MIAVGSINHNKDERQSPTLVINPTIGDPTAVAIVLAAVIHPIALAFLFKG